MRYKDTHRKMQVGIKLRAAKITQKVYTISLVHMSLSHTTHKRERTSLGNVPGPLDVRFRCVSKPVQCQTSSHQVHAHRADSALLLCMTSSTRPLRVVLESLSAMVQLPQSTLSGGPIEVLVVEYISLISESQRATVRKSRVPQWRTSPPEIKSGPPGLGKLSPPTLFLPPLRFWSSPKLSKGPQSSLGCQNKQKASQPGSRTLPSGVTFFMRSPHPNR